MRRKRAERRKTAMELLVRALLSPRRKPVMEKYRTQAFVSFVEVGETAAVEVPAGWWGVAYRFVNYATGQATQIVQLPRVQVE